MVVGDECLDGIGDHRIVILRNQGSIDYIIDEHFLLWAQLSTVGNDAGNLLQRNGEGFCKGSTLNMAGRVAAAAVFVLLMKMDIEALPYSYVVGWILMLVYEAPMMVKYLRKGEL